MDICRRRFGVCILAGLASRAFALPPRPKLLVLFILEHMRPDYLDSVWAQVGTRGLRRLVENGAYFPDCRHLASSFPTSSLATLATGAWPAQHGIVADQWYDRKDRGPRKGSADSLLATTFAAQVAAAPNTRVYTVSLDPIKGDIVTATPQAHTFWMDSEGRFTTTGDNPQWLAEYNAMHPLQNLHGKEWLAVGAKSGAPALRRLLDERPEEFFALFQASPFSQDAQFDFVSELLTREKIGQGNTFDLLCVVVSSAASLGYETGANSALMQQMTLRLDQKLAVLLDQLDRAPGGDTYDLVLVGAHGAPPGPPSAARPRSVVNGENLAQAIQRRLAQAKIPRIEKYLYPFVYLEAAGGRAPDAAAVAVGRAALEEDEVAAYYTAGGDCSVHNQWEQRFRNSFHPVRSGDLMLSYQSEYVEDFGTGHGISYGSIYDYDIKVPLCLFGPQFRAGVFEAPVESVDIAPTLARAIGMPPPSSSTGRVLGEAFLGSEEPK